MVRRKTSKGSGAGKKKESADSSIDAADKHSDAVPAPASAMVKEELPTSSAGERETGDPPVVVDPEATQADLPTTHDSKSKEEQHDAPKELPEKNPPPIERGAGEGPGAVEEPKAVLPETATAAAIPETNVKPQSSLGTVGGLQGGSTSARESQDAPHDDDDKGRVRAEEKPAEEGGSSDEEDGDGFRVVVGREAAPPAAPAAPVKRFLRGTNTLVNNSTAASSGGAESRGSAASAKPVSAAAGIASLVPSKGAPVAPVRSSLKPGQYPPTAELQNEAGRTAFDVDIDGMEEQPWRHPGVDIADFFNYGFTEDSWRVYCEKQLRNRYDQNLGRSKNAKGNSLRVGGSSHMRHGAGGGMRRSGGRLGGQERPAQFHNNGSDRPNFSSHGSPPGNGWGPAGQGQERFPPHGFGSGAPSGVSRGSSSPPWFDTPQQMHSGNRQKFGPGQAGGQGRGGGSEREGSKGSMRRSRSPGPREGPSDKMARLR